MRVFAPSEAGRGARRWRIGVLALALVVAGCGFDPSDHTLPGTGVRGAHYRLVVEFESLLSLPAGATVRSNGAEVGAVEQIRLDGHAALADLDIRAEVGLPVGTRAELRQTTVLGDIYIALLPPPHPGTDLLRDGDRIPLRDTETGPQIEQILERMAAFVNGGSATRTQDALEQLVAMMPADPAETSALAAQLGTDLAATVEHLPDLDRMIAATDAVSARLHRMREEVGFLFSETARRRLDRVPQFMTAVLNVVIDVNTLTTGLDWLIPRLPHINEALEKAATLLREPSPDASTWAGNGARLSELMTGKVVPFLGAPALNVRRIGVTGSPSGEVDALILLRLIGVLP
ncbi:MlaD family protein [Nocardia farcinica]|uniref:Virulence factor Mce family protein n=1 Tax=Nocardia farcinica TaxID=37329 RepID=A0A449GDX1_NOCFR|nr:MlaD family protein [Nocardia farcinica]MBF6518756.1 MCE family protein [Nocardia farcinica]VFA90795.1 virulence factor Mce family protein [Nocardia farcinica]